MADSSRRGVSLIEFIIAFAVIAIIVTIVLPVFSTIKKNQVLNNAVENVASALDQARSQTLASLDSSEYGVRFEADEIIIFKGMVYSSGAPGNEVIEIAAPATISNVTLGGVSGSTGELYFNRLTGMPNKAGTVTLSVSGTTRTVTISATGATGKN